MTQSSVVAAYAGVARAPFLALSIVLVANGAAAQAYAGAFSLGRTILALVGLTAMHVAVNVRNEVSDFETGIDLVTERTPFSGGSGTLPAGRLRTASARWFGWSAVLLGAVVAVLLVAQVGAALIPIIGAGLVLVLGYTPWFTRLGIGELAAGLGLGFLPVIGTALVQDGSVGASAVAAAVPAFFMTFNLLLLNEFPDVIADRAGGRRTLVIALGQRRAAQVYLLAVAGTLVAIIAGVVHGALPITCLGALAPAIFLVNTAKWALSSPESPVPIPALAGNVIWNLSTNALLAAGFVVGLLL